MWDEKFTALKTYIKALMKEDICIAFSGGIDSSLLLKIASELSCSGNTKVYAVFFSTRLHPRADMEIVRKVAKECQVDLNILEVDENENLCIRNNPPDRCYHCKKYLFEQLKDFAEKRNVKKIIDGTNADDLEEYRPGLKALKELGIISPLAEFSISKNEVRKMAKQLGISVADRPSAPCMATRLPYGTRIDYSLLERLEQGEKFLKSLGYLIVRLRIHGEVLRMEIEKKEFVRCLEQMEEITEKMKELGFTYVTLDLEGFRSGSMDVNLKDI